MITAAWPDGSAIQFLPQPGGFVGKGSVPRLFSYDPPGTLRIPPDEPVIKIRGSLTFTATALRALAGLIERTEP